MGNFVVDCSTVIHKVIDFSVIRGKTRSLDIAANSDCYCSWLASQQHGNSSHVIKNTCSCILLVLLFHGFY